MSAHKPYPFAAGQVRVIHARGIDCGPRFADDGQTGKPERVTCPKCRAALDAAGKDR